MVELSNEGGEDKYNNMAPGNTGYVNDYVYNKTNEIGNHTDSKHYLDTNDPDFAEDYFNLLESGMGQDKIVWYNYHTKVPESRSYLHAAI